MKESAQQIWLAGLGAFAKNQEEGKKMFEKLVDDGLRLQKKTQSTLNAKVHEATDKISEMTNSLSKQAPNSWAPLEDIFENRVAKANEKLGVPSEEAFEALSARVAQLEKLLQRASNSPIKKAPAKAANSAQAAQVKTRAKATQTTKTAETTVSSSSTKVTLQKPKA